MSQQNASVMKTKSPLQPPRERVFYTFISQSYRQSGCLVEWRQHPPTGLSMAQSAREGNDQLILDIIIYE